MQLPGWLDDLLDAVCTACVCEVKGRLSGFSYRWASPEQNPWGAWLLQIAPVVLEIAGGPEDGATGFDYVDVDLLALPQCLEEVESFTYDSDFGAEPRLLLVGKKRQHAVVIEVYFAPFADDQPRTVFDVHRGGWRDRRTDAAGG
jgi:hypothetical protein